MLVGEALAAILTLAAWTGDPLRLFAVISLATQFALALLLACYYVAARSMHRLSASSQGHAALALALMVTIVVAMAIRFTFEPASSLDGSEWTTLLLRLVGIVVLVGVLAAVAFQNYLQARRLAVRAKQAELEALQARIRPHFLFNTLNTGASLVHQRPEEAERLLLDLADLFRAALAGPRDIPLEEELSLARRYLEIESLRFGERLRVSWELPREIPHAMVPALSIQPLVENAIRHGVERVPHGGRVEIALTTTPEHIVVRITNPLVLSDLEKPVSHQVGLNAAQVRIEALTGGRGSVQTGRQGELYVATVRLPRRPSAPPARGKWR
jgi:two-component system sensor histidine kinase AlgZ